MAGMAVQASVAVQTVYFSFRNKPGLLRAAVAFAVHGDHEPMPPAERDWYRAMAEGPDLRRTLKLLVVGTLAMQRRIMPLAPVLQTFRHDSDVAEFQQLDHALGLDGSLTAAESESRPAQAATVSTSAEPSSNPRKPSRTM